MNAIIDMDHIDDPLFAHQDLQHYRQNPAALENAPDDVLLPILQRHSAFDVIRTMARDLAARDAEITTLRRRVEEIGSIFKDHMCNVHTLSRLEADRIVHEHIVPATSPELFGRIQEASSSFFTDAQPSYLIDNNGKSSQEPVPLRPRSNTSTVRGMLAAFGGRGPSRPDKDKRQSIAGVLQPVKSADDRRRSSLSHVSNSSALPTPTPGPVEMNAIVETENLPPPLVTSAEVKGLYPKYTADIYGFIIDNGRTAEWISKHRPVSPPQRRGADTPMTSASSVKSTKEDTESDVEREDGPDNETETDSRAWTHYLKFGGSTIGSLSWLPVALLPSASPMETVATTSTNLAEMGVGAAAQKLQHQLSVDYEKLQQSRKIPWEKFLASDKQEREQGAFFSSLLGRGQPTTRGQQRLPDSAVSLGSLPKELRLERTRLVLGGVPMQLRERIWSQFIHESIMHEPDEYQYLIRQSAIDVDKEVRSEIEDDIPRTLANNVYFRAGKGRTKLRELLCCFGVKKAEIGYCQGMNLIGGYLLLALPSTETAFWVFCYMIEHVLAEVYFDATMRGGSIEISVLRSYVRDLIPRLAKHLEDLDIADQETVPYNWFLTAFASTLTIEALYRVWDVVLGLPTQKNFLLRVGIALLKVNEENLLAIDDPFELRNYMDRSMAGHDVSIDGLIKASSELGRVIRDDEVKKRRRHFAFKIDEPMH